MKQFFETILLQFYALTGLYRVEEYEEIEPADYEDLANF